MVEVINSQKDESTYPTFTQSSGSYTDSPLYGAESWERTGDNGLQSSRRFFYHSSPRMTRQQQQGTPKRSAKSFFCTDLCLDSCTQLKEKCALWKVLCSLNFMANRCCCQISQTYKQHFFFSKSLVLVLLLNALFSTAVFGVTTEVVKLIIGAEYLLLRTLMIHGITQVMFPIGGHLADLYVGRHNMIRFSLWMAWLGLALLGLTFALDGYINEINPFTRFVIFPSTAILLSISYVCFMSNIIPLGLDQLQGASHVHYSSFFYWWYWTLNIGFINIPQYCKNNVEIDVLIQAGIGLVLITIAIVLDALFKHWLVIEPICKKANPLVQIMRILKDACRQSKNQRIPSVVFHEVNIQQFGRMDRMKKRYGGKYETEQVEDVKTFFRVLLVLTGIGFSTLIYTGVFDTIGLMAANMRGTLASFTINTDPCQVNISLLNAMNGLILVIFIPILDLVVVPLLRHTFVNPTIMWRLGFGSFFALVTALCMFVIHSVGNVNSRLCILRAIGSPLRMDISVYWILLPVVILTIAEVFIYIPGFEFTCAQTPYNMRGLVIGIFFSVQGIFSLLSVLMQYVFMTSQYTFPTLTCSGWYYLVLLCFSVFGFLFFLLVACKYKRRRRDEVFNSVTLIEEHFVSFLNRRNHEAS